MIMFGSPGCGCFKITSGGRGHVDKAQGRRRLRALGLVGPLSDEQKKTADEVLAPHMGMMPMMQGRMGAMPMQGK
ncbi:hypothetical protein [Bradyrhizobium nanningense]|nr:hypothetical protein [Bradyrhizobium nanningense]